MANVEHPQDKGCRLSSSCLNCPLAKCIEDEPGGRRRIKTVARKMKMAEMKHSGKSVKEIAKALNISKRTVQRALQ